MPEVPYSYFCICVWNHEIHYGFTVKMWQPPCACVEMSDDLTSADLLLVCEMNIVTNLVSCYK